MLVSDTKGPPLGGLFFGLGGCELALQPKELYILPNSGY